MVFPLFCSSSSSSAKQQVLRTGTTDVPASHIRQSLSPAIERKHFGNKPTRYSTDSIYTVCDLSHGMGGICKQACVNEACEEMNKSVFDASASLVTLAPMSSANMGRDQKKELCRKKRGANIFLFRFIFLLFR